MRNLKPALIALAGMPTTGVRARWPRMSPEMLAGTPMETAFQSVAPKPERFAVLVDKMRGRLPPKT